MDYPLRPVPFTLVSFEDDFWQPRLKTHLDVTIPDDFEKCEETGRIENFDKAAGIMEGTFEGIYFNDSDVFKNDLLGGIIVIRGEGLKAHTVLRLVAPGSRSDGRLAQTITG